MILSLCNDQQAKGGNEMAPLLMFSPLVCIDVFGLHMYCKDTVTIMHNKKYVQKK